MDIYESLQQLNELWDDYEGRTSDQGSEFDYGIDSPIHISSYDYPYDNELKDIKELNKQWTNGVKGIDSIVDFDVETNNNQLAAVPDNFLTPHKKEIDMTQKELKRAEEIGRDNFVPFKLTPIQDLNAKIRFYSSDLKELQHIIDTDHRQQNKENAIKETNRILDIINQAAKKVHPAYSYTWNSETNKLERHTDRTQVK